jgi:hypothetical protein
LDLAESEERCAAIHERTPMEDGWKEQGLAPRKPMRRRDGPQAENESVQSVEEEPADVERDVPDVENEPVEGDGGQDEPEAPIFEE